MSKGKNDVSIDSFIYETVKQNSNVNATSDDWLTLAFTEPLLAIKHKATINQGERAMKSLYLF